MADGGKGSTQRPRSVSDEEWASRYDAIFQRDLRQSNEVRMEQCQGFCEAQSFKHLIQSLTEERNALRSEVTSLRMSSQRLVETCSGLMRNIPDVPTVKDSLTVPLVANTATTRALIEGIMSTPTCGHPFCQCVVVCKEAK